jgi:hypothetical protein
VGIQKGIWDKMASHKETVMFFCGNESRVLDNKVLRRIFGSKGYEVTQAQRKLHIEKLLRRAVHVPLMGEINAYTIVVDKLQAKRQYGKRI